MKLDMVLEDILKFINKHKDEKFNLIIGTDSHTRDKACFVTAIVLHHVGSGARYYYHKRKQDKITSLRQKLYYETAISLEVASKITDFFEDKDLEKFNLEIHLDLGSNGETRSLIKEIVGMVVGSGFNAIIKPDACGASTVADKHTKS
jgi:predicted RNase H-related nuclease YkuK (DUF458 family)